MRRWAWPFVLLLAGAFTMAFAGDIQVTCEPGLRVYLDGRFVGLCNAKDDGFFLEAVGQGPHVLRIEKAGFVPQTYPVVVTLLPIEVKVTAFTPEPPTPPGPAPGGAKGSTSVGSLQIMSAPQNCTVLIDGKEQPKTTPIIVIGGLAEGEHTISFAKPGYQTVSGVVSIQGGGEVSVRGDLVTGKVEEVFEGKGSLRMLSTPEYCTVWLRGKTYDKTSQKLNITYIPAGEHKIVVQWKSATLSSKVKIFKGMRTLVVVSFQKDDQPFVFSYEPE